MNDYDLLINFLIREYERESKRSPVSGDFQSGYQEGQCQSLRFALAYASGRYNFSGENVVDRFIEWWKLTHPSEFPAVDLTDPHMGPTP